MDARALIELPSLDHIEEFGPGDNVTINYTVAEEGRERVQAFKGNVIRGKYVRGYKPPVGSTFIVRRVAFGLGVERGIPFYSPFLSSVKVNRRGKVRKARIFYLRKLSGRKARIKELKVHK